MQNLTTRSTFTTKQNYDFIDAIRALAMMCIVADHCFHMGIFIFPIKTVNFWLYITDIQLVKIGTVCFFLLAGFLLGDKFADYSAFDYLRRRFKSTFGPWILWSLVFVWFILHLGPGFDNKWDWILNAFKTCYLFSNYWFIINFLICIGTLLVFKRHLYSLKLGAVLLLITLFYSINIYHEWIFPMHTTAVFGFVFFLWLGAQFNKKWPAIERWIKQVPLYAFILVALLTWAFATFEIAYLYNLKSTDPFNSLRISNILYSIAVFFLLVKIKKYKWLLKLKPRETTYGIFLIHYIVVYAFLPGWLSALKAPPIDQMSLAGMITFQLLRFVIVYVVTFFVVKLINKFSFKWIIGR
ncbi:acyltransferase family protein [Mucilaginibacter sp. AW1-3]